MSARLRPLLGGLVVVLGWCFIWSWQQRWEPIALLVGLYAYGAVMYLLGAAATS